MEFLFSIIHLEYVDLLQSEQTIFKKKNHLPYITDPTQMNK